ncbi:MAG: holo-ACP synthase [Fusobacterium perfoetens]|uniref:holo-ACP synthase n=1 Tax=Fusobacterium perfoetens TaxID=852 RepID=UPI0023F3A36F|nr:holo-ACP synthase [Fusobacterium perfoetens]MCI6153069.1 holo-ACP synthase [Fusobacterium perfoetens]MDY3237466.1 holo-ACP synthase [Fusobacterium perfoetens]
MEFVGIGNDIIEIKRIEKAIKNSNFIKKVFTENEIKLFEIKGNRVETYAGRFAAKEAISKSLGTGFKGFSLTDIEVLNDDLGKPYVIFKNNIKEYNKKYSVNISISHCKEYATAVAITFKRSDI